MTASAPSAERGSSPLARGLPRSLASPVILCRIIPARAGFTTCGDPTSPRSSDHPRSRGVYCPLVVHLKIISGIIPARAGFTGSADEGRAGNVDHPRSRGVYHPNPRHSSASQGSSPLARGLPPIPARVSGPAGIIPARAGFTLFCDVPHQPSWDHPRSRGVYDENWIVRPGTRGSSPLARGLRPCP